MRPMWSLLVAVTLNPLSSRWSIQSVQQPQVGDLYTWMLWAAAPARAAGANPSAAIRPKARVCFFMTFTSGVQVGVFRARPGQPEPPDYGGHQGQTAGIHQKRRHWHRSIAGALWLVLNSRRRLALVTTVTEDSDMATPARIGLISTPHTG